MLKGLACGAFKRVLAVFERVLAVLRKISTLWGRVHRMLTLKSAPSIHSVHSKKCSYTTRSLNPRGDCRIDVKG